MKNYIKQNILLTILFFFLSFISNGIIAQESIKFITYGTGTQTKEGDDDYREVFVLRVPENYKNKLFLRIFDIDCGGTNDFQGTKSWNSNTQFSLYGGSDSLPLMGIHSATPDGQDLTSGIELRNESFGESGIYDNDWMTFSSFMPQDGYLSGGYYYFRLIAEGKDGTNGNVFDVFLSTSDLQNISVERAEILNYSPTVRLLKRDQDAELRFGIPAQTTSLEIMDFDVAGAGLHLRTALRSGVALKSSGDGVWATNKIDLLKEEDGRGTAVILAQGGETPNDATFRIKTNSGEFLPINCPIYPSRHNTPPKLSYIYDYVSDCYSLVFDATASTDAENDFLQFKWSFGDGSFGEGNRIVHKYEKQQTYDVYVVITDNSSSDYNSSIAFFKVKVNKPPVAVFQPSLILSPGEEFMFDGTSSYDEDDGLKSYTWEFGDAQKREGKTVSYAYPRAGRYTARFSVTDNSASPCNVAFTDVNVWINLKPVAAAGEDKSASIGQSISFDGRESRDDDGKIAEYRWDFGDGNTASGAEVEHVYATAGVFTATLTITDDAGVKNSKVSDQLVVVVNATPIPNPGSDKIAAENEPLFFDGSASMDPDGIISDYLWDFGDGSTAKGVKAAHTYSKSGRYDVKLTVVDNSNTNSNTASASLTVVVNSRPVSVAGDDAVITRSEFQFDGTSSSDPDGKVLKYFWDFGDGKTSTEASPKHFYEKPGVYRVKLRVTDETKAQNNFNVSEFELVVNAKPIADAGPDMLGAPDQSLRFDGSKSYDSDGKIVDFIWDFGDGQTSSGAIVEHRYTNQGTFYARLTVKDNTQQSNAVGYDEVKVIVNEKPYSNAGRDIITAPGSEVVFDGLASFDRDGKIENYTWSFSDTEEIFSGATQKRVFEDAGIYTGILEVKDNSNAINGFSTDTVWIRVNSSPLAKAGTNIFTCETKLILDGSTSSDTDGDPLSYSWNFGDGSSLESGSRVIHEYKKGGTYPVILTVDDGLGLPNSKSVASITVKINEPPFAFAGEDLTVCAGEVVRLNAAGSTDPEGGFLRYTWEFGDGTGADGINPTKIYKIGGSYQVRLKVEDDSGLPCNTTFTTKTITVIESPVAFAGEDMIVCLNSVVKFDGTKSRDNDGVVNNYLWDFGDGSTGGGPNPSHVFTKAGTYNVRLTITGDLIGECDNTHTDELVVKVFEAPIADFTIPVIYPKDYELVLTTEGSTTFSDSLIGVNWNFGEGSVSDEFTGKHIYTQEGKYTITLTILTNSTTDCKSASIQKIIIINAPPTAAAGDTIRSGIGQEIFFNAGASKDIDGSIISFEWNFGDGNSGIGLTVRHKYAEGGVYPVILKVKDNTSVQNSTASDTTWAIINFTPNPVIISKENICPGDIISFSAANSNDADSDELTFDWELGDGSSSNLAEFTHVYRAPGIYNVTLVANDGKSFVNSKNKIIKQIQVNNKPLADAGRDQLVCLGDKVVLDASSSFDADGDNLIYEWYRDRDKIADGKISEVTFNEGGVYVIRLKVSDGKGTGCSESENDVVITVNATPAAITQYKTFDAYTGGAHDQVLFDGSASTDSDGDALSYVWDFGDGGQSSGAKVYHYFDRPGVYNVVLTIDDGKKSNCSRNTSEIIVTVKSR